MSFLVAQKAWFGCFLPLVRRVRRSRGVGIPTTRVCWVCPSTVTAILTPAIEKSLADLG
jgi:hypothetical protein